MIRCLQISHTYLMEPHQLRTFVAVARHRSFSAAAAELGYTPAAVSQPIAALAADLTTQLRTRPPATPAGAAPPPRDPPGAAPPAPGGPPPRRHQPDENPASRPAHRGNP